MIVINRRMSRGVNSSRPNWRGEPRVEVYPSESDGGIDRETGLPVVVVRSDESDMAATGRVSGHNDALREYIEKNGPIPGSRKKWEADLLHLADSFNRSLRTEKPVSLTGGGGPANSAGGKYTILLREASASSQPSLATHDIVLFGPAGQMGVSLPAGVDPSANVVFFWGPAGSDTAIFRFKASDPTFAALDLRSGQWLSVQPPATADRLTRTGE